MPVQLYPPKGKTKKRKLTVALPPEFVPPAATAETSNDPDDDAVYVIQVVAESFGSLQFSVLGRGREKWW